MQRNSTPASNGRNPAQPKGEHQQPLTALDCGYIVGGLFFDLAQKLKYGGIMRTIETPQYRKAYAVACSIKARTNKRPAIMYWCQCAKEMLRNVK